MTITATMADCGKEPFFLDWTEFYERHGLDPLVDLITSSVWTVTGGTGGTQFLSTPNTGIFLSGGTPGTPILAENTIQINGGTYQDCRTLRVEVFT